NIYDDKTRQEELVRQSDLEWILIRPGLLTERPASGVYRVTADATQVGSGRSSISRADLASFIVDQLANQAYLHKVAHITG
ncbi:MAG TPA: NAD(P)H-binding protein, partial [Gemmatimonadales bacterium]|nr:NAD(P)H-binding protein [Gemmatimonadales bacterium]